MAAPTTIGQALNDLFPGYTAITQTKEKGNDAGIDVSLPANYQVKATSAGLYRQDLSTAYQQVFQLGNGLFESYTHVTKPSTGEPPIAYKGAVVGIVSPLSGNYSDSGITYHSSGPHVEVGFVRNPTGAGSFFSSNTLDPQPILIQQAGGKSTPTTAQQNPSLFPSTPNTNNQTGNSDSWTLASIGGFNLSIPKAPIEHLGFIIGIALFVLIVVAVLGFSLIKGGESSVIKRATNVST